MTHVGQTLLGSWGGGLADVTRGANEQMSCQPDAESFSKERVSLTQRHSEAAAQQGKEAFGGFPKRCQRVQLEHETLYNVRSCLFLPAALHNSVTWNVN